MSDNKEITKRLDAILLLLMKFAPKASFGSEQDKIVLLNQLGFANVEIAILLGKTSNQVKALLHLGKKKGKK